MLIGLLRSHVVNKIGAAGTARKKLARHAVQLYTTDFSAGMLSRAACEADTMTPSHPSTHPSDCEA